MKWINVKNRLPEPETEVLVFTCSSQIKIFIYGYNRYGELHFMRMNDDGYWWEVYDVTHWMPMPNAPSK